MWTRQHIELENRQIKLIPLEEKYFDALFKMADDLRIWAFYAFNGADPEVLKKSINKAIEDRQLEKQYPFVIQLKSNNQIIGSTRLMDIKSQHKNLEIGATWLHPDFWGTGLNTECKYELLKFSFETLHYMRVSIRTNQYNIRSRRAIEKLGAQYEGILRKEIMQDNGVPRNTAYYSIIDEEWPEIKNKLFDQINTANLYKG